MRDWGAELLSPNQGVAAQETKQRDWGAELLGSPSSTQPTNTTLPPLTASDTAAEIVSQQDAGGFPQGARNERGFWDKAGDVISGGDRRTSATRNLPELGSEIGLDEFLGLKGASERFQSVPFGAAALTTSDPVEMVKILQEKAGDKLTVRPDEAGNIIVGLDGREAILNKPGFTPFDAMQLGGIMAVFTPAGRAGLTTTTIPRGMAAVGAASGATQAVIEGVQRSQGGEVNPLDVGIATAGGAAFQGLFQKMAQHIPVLRQKIKSSGITQDIRDIYQRTAVQLGMRAEDVTDDVIRASVDQAETAVSPNVALAVQGEREFGIPLTAGQRSLDDAALSAEDRMRVGLSGDRAQRVMRGFEEETQKPAINAAAEAVQARLGGVPGKPGSVIREGVRTAEREADDVVGAAYEAVGDAALTPDGVKGLFRQVRSAVRGVEYDKSLPETAKLLSTTSSFMKLVGREKGGQGVRIKPLDLQTIEQYRRRINTAITAAENPADKRQVMIMKRAFDDYLDGAVQNALFSGDDTAIASLKDARGLFSEYAKKFRAQPVRGKSGRIVDRDEAGQFIEKLIDADPTDEQVVNAVFGASGFSKTSGPAMARRFRDILGTDSEGWKAIRTAAVRRLIQTTRDGKGVEMVSGAKTKTAIQDALKKNDTLMKELFSEDEISLLNRFAFHVKRTQAAPQRSRENPSGTAQVAGKALADVVGKIGHVFAISGEPLMWTTATGVQTARAATQGGKAAAAIRPFSGRAPLRPEIVPGAIALEQKL